MRADIGLLSRNEYRSHAGISSERSVEAIIASRSVFIGCSRSVDVGWFWPRPTATIRKSGESVKKGSRDAGQLYLNRCLGMLFGGGDDPSLDGFTATTIRKAAQCNR